MHSQLFGNSHFVFFICYYILGAWQWSFDTVDTVKMKTIGQEYYHGGWDPKGVNQELMPNLTAVSTPQECNL